jgi:2-phospho-L-lactate/phosphoenolpyruvate guanylyltransferase
MVVYAIVPVKRLGVSKRRLSESLSLQERKALTVAMLEDVLSALKTSVIEKVLVVSNDPKVRSIAEKFGADFFAPSRKGLNCAVEEAFAWCIRKKADSVLVLPSDIPLITSKDVDIIVELGLSEGRRVVLVPSRDGGTNAFLQCPPHLIRACFGPESFSKHVQEACSKDVCIRFYYSLGVGLDIDCAADLEVLKEVLNYTQSKQVLKDFKKKD